MSATFTHDLGSAADIKPTVPSCCFARRSDGVRRKKSRPTWLSSIATRRAGSNPTSGCPARVRDYTLVNPKGRTDPDVWAGVVGFWRGTEALSPLVRAFVRLLLLLGLRRGEAAAAVWTDIDLEADPAVWHLPAFSRKGRVQGSAGERKALDIPLPALAVSILRDLRDQHAKGEARVFPRLWLGGIGAEVKKVTDLPELRLHDLRRTTASGIQRLGAPPHVISTVLGHVETGGAQSDAAYRHGGRFEEHRFWLHRWADHVARLGGVEEEQPLLASSDGARSKP